MATVTWTTTVSQKARPPLYWLKFIKTTRIFNNYLQEASPFNYTLNATKKFDTVKNHCVTSMAVTESSVYTLDSWSASGRSVGSAFNNILRWSRTSSGMFDSRETFSIFSYKCKNLHVRIRMRTFIKSVKHSPSRAIWNTKQSWSFALSRSLTEAARPRTFG